VVGSDGGRVCQSVETARDRSTDAGSHAAAASAAAAAVVRHFAHLP